MKNKFVALIIVIAILAISVCSIVITAAGLSLSDKTVETVPESGEALPEADEEISIQEPISKDEIYHKSLNTIDYFDTASGKVAAKFLNTAEYVVTYMTDMKNHESYERFTDGVNDIEEYCLNLQRTEYNNVSKSHRSVGAPVVFKEEVQPLADSKRLQKMETDGQQSIGLCCYYRDDPTNLTQSSVSLFPQALAVGFLSNKDLWSIDGRIEYLGRTCVAVSGTTENGNYKGVAAFTLYIDEETGVWLDFEGVDNNGNTVLYIRTSEFSVNQPVDVNFDAAKYSDYSLS